MSEKRSGEDHEAAGANGPQPAKQQRIENHTNSNLASSSSSSSSSSAAAAASTGSGSAIHITPAKPPSAVMFTVPSNVFQFSSAPLPVRKAAFGTLAPVDSALEILTRTSGFSAAELELNGPIKYSEKLKKDEISRDTLIDLSFGALMRVAKNSTTPIHVASHFNQVVPYKDSFDDTNKSLYGTSEWRFEENATEATLTYDKSFYMQMQISLMPPSYLEQLLQYMADFKKWEPDTKKHPLQLFGNPDPTSPNPGYVLVRFWLWPEWVPHFLSMFEQIKSELAEGGVLMIMGKRFRLHRDCVTTAAKGKIDHGWFVTPQKAFASQQGVSTIGFFGFVRSTESGDMKFVFINPPVISAFKSTKKSGGGKKSTSSSSSASS